MKVICIENKFYGDDYIITIDEEYIVMGLMISKRTENLNYLISRSGFPTWFPNQLFKISDNKITDHWFIKTYPSESPGTISFLSGFDELCNNEDFHDALMEREDWAMEIFYKRLKEQEEYYDDQYWIKLGQKANNK